MRILIHIALFAMLAGFLIPSIDGCCCDYLTACTGPSACNVFGCNCDTYCYNGRCGYCQRCGVNVVPGGFSVGTDSISIGFDFESHGVALNDENLECCGSGN